MRVYYCLLALLFSLPVSAGTIPGSKSSSGNWKISAYTHDPTGKFSHCAMNASYDGGDTLHFSVNADATVSIGISNRLFRFTPGETFPVVLKVDKRAPFYGQAQALGPDFAFLKLPDFDRAMTAFKKGYRLTVDTGTRLGVYNLKGTFRALETVKQCAVAYIRYADAPKATGSTRTVANSGDKSLLYQIATGMITEAGVKDFRYFTTAELETMGFGDAVFWTSPSASLVGGVLLTDAVPGQDLRDRDAQDIHEITSGCKGDVLSGARGVETADLPMREIRVICTDDKLTQETIVSKVLWGNKILYTTLIFVDDGENVAAEGKDRRAMSEDVTIRAASFLPAEE